MRPVNFLHLSILFLQVALKKLCQSLSKPMLLGCRPSSLWTALACCERYEFFALHKDTMSISSQLYETMFLKKQLDRFEEWPGGIWLFKCTKNGCAILSVVVWAIHGTSLSSFSRCVKVVAGAALAATVRDQPRAFSRDATGWLRCPIQMTPMLEPVRIIHEVPADHSTCQNSAVPLMACWSEVFWTSAMDDFNNQMFDNLWDWLWPMAQTRKVAFMTSRMLAQDKKVAR